MGVIRSFFTILAPLPELEQKVIRSIDDIKTSIQEKVKNGTFFVAFVVVKPDGTKQVSLLFLYLRVFWYSVLCTYMQ